MDPWISEQSAWILGPVLGGGVGGVLCGAIGGGVCGVLAARGRARGFVMGYYAFLIVLGIASLGVGLSALTLGQPYHVWYPFTLMGIILLIVMASIRPAITKQYEAAEQRRLDAQAVRSA